MTGMWFTESARGQGQEGKKLGCWICRKSVYERETLSEAPPRPTSFLLTAQVPREQQARNKCVAYQTGQLRTQGHLRPFFFVFVPLDIHVSFVFVFLSAHSLSLSFPPRSPSPIL